MTAPIHNLGFRRLGVLIDDEGALDIDFNRARMRDGTIYFGSICAHAEVLRGRGIVLVVVVVVIVEGFGCLRGVRRHGGELLARVPGKV